MMRRLEFHRVRDAPSVPTGKCSGPNMRYTVLGGARAI